MDIVTTYVKAVDAIPGLLDIPHSLAHVHAGLLLYMAVQMLLRTRRASAIALQAVYGTEIVHEILQSAYYGSWRWTDTRMDILMTVLWPTLLYTMSRYRRARWERHKARQAAVAALLPAVAHAGTRPKA